MRLNKPAIAAWLVVIEYRLHISAFVLDDHGLSPSEGFPSCHDAFLTPFCSNDRIMMPSRTLPAASNLSLGILRHRWELIGRNEIGKFPMDICTEATRVISHFRQQLKHRHEHELGRHVSSHLLSLIIRDERQLVLTLHGCSSNSRHLSSVGPKAAAHVGVRNGLLQLRYLGFQKVVRDDQRANSRARIAVAHRNRLIDRGLQPIDLFVRPRDRGYGLFQVDR